MGYVGGEVDGSEVRVGEEGFTEGIVAGGRKGGSPKRLFGPGVLLTLGRGREGEVQVFFSLASAAHEREERTSWNKEGRWVNW
mgnify:CR=1 FL=1